MSCWKLIYRVISGNKSVYFGMCFAALIVAMGEIGIPWLLKDIVDVALLGEKHVDLNTMGIWMACLVIISYLAYVYWLRLEFQIVQKGTNQLRQYLYSRLIQQPMSFFSTKKMGELLHRVLQDTNIFEIHIRSILCDLPYDIVIIVSVFTLMFIINKILMLAVLLFFVTCGIGAGLISKPLMPISKRIHTISAELGSRLHETLAGIRIIKNFSQEKEEITRLDNLNIEVLSLKEKTNKIEAFLLPFFDFMDFFVVILVAWVGVHLLVTKQIATGDLVVFILYVEILAKPFSRVGDYSDRWRQINGVSARINDFLAMIQVPSVTSFTGKVHPKDIFPIQFEDVSFRYSENTRLVLKKVTFTVQKGDMLAIAGLNGAGKSTLLDLLLGFQKPTNGHILVGGTNLFDLDEKEWRSRIGILPQEIYLFHDSILKNISYSMPNVSLQEVEAVAKEVHLDGLLERLPLGLSTLVGEKGVQLSGGERKKIALARLLLQKPEILILDEPTAHLDINAINEFTKMLEDLSKSKTILMIDHRAEVVKKFDKIILLDKGELVAVGQFKQLAKKFTWLQKGS